MFSRGKENYYTCNGSYNHTGKKACCEIKLDYQEVETLIYNTKEQLIQFTDETVKYWRFGLGCDRTEDSKRLTLYLNTLLRFQREYPFETNKCRKKCFCDINDVMEYMRDIITASCEVECRTDVIIDSSGKEEWMKANPFCVTREEWEKLAYKICSEIGFTVTTSQVACDIAFEITRDIIPCEILFAVSLYQTLCDLGFEVQRDDTECKIDYKLLIEEFDCDLEFDIYLKLVHCNMSYDIIKKVYECDLALDFCDKNKCPILITEIGEYKLNDLDFEKLAHVETIPEITDLFTTLTSDYNTGTWQLNKLG